MKGVAKVEDTQNGEGGEVEDSGEGVKEVERVKVRCGGEKEEEKRFETFGPETTEEAAPYLYIDVNINNEELHTIR